MQLLKAGILGVVVAVAAGLLLTLLGAILESLRVPIAVTVGDFLMVWAWVLGLLAGLWYFAKNLGWVP